MAKSKLVKVSEKIAEKAVDGYKKIEDTVVGGYKKIEDGFVGGFQKIEDKFVDSYLTKEDESIEEAKERLAKERADREAEEKELLKEAIAGIPSVTVEVSQGNIFEANMKMTMDAMSDARRKAGLE